MRTLNYTEKKNVQETENAKEKAFRGIRRLFAVNLRKVGAERVFANDFTVLSQRVLKDAHLKLFLDLAGTRFDAILGCAMEAWVFFRFQLLLRRAAPSAVPETH